MRSDLLGLVIATTFLEFGTLSVHSDAVSISQSGIGNVVNDHSINVTSSADETVIIAAVIGALATIVAAILPILFKKFRRKRKA